MAITRVGIVGSGIMGSGIAEVAAKAGHEVVLRSRQQETADAMVASLEKSPEPAGREGPLEEADRDAALGRVTATADARRPGRLRPGDRVGGRGPRHQEGAVRRARPDLPATTPSSPPTPRPSRSSRWRSRSHNPDRVCGVHFFNPAPMMSLVEIIRPLTASDETIAAAKAFAEACGKDPVEVKDRAGFIVNALLFPYLNNAVRMLENGTATPGRHRHRHEGRLQLPDGPAGAARPRRPRHVARHPRRPLRRVPRPELRRRARSCAAWSPPASSAGSRARASTTTAR